MGAGAYPCCLWAKVAYILDMSPGHHRGNAERQRSIRTHFNAYRQFSVTKSPNLLVFTLWEEGGKPERTHAHTE